MEAELRCECKRKLPKAEGAHVTREALASGRAYQAGMFPAGNFVLWTPTRTSCFPPEPSALGFVGIRVLEDIQRHSKDLHDFSC